MTMKALEIKCPTCGARPETHCHRLVDGDPMLGSHLARRAEASRLTMIQKGHGGRR